MRDYFLGWLVGVGKFNYVEKKRKSHCHTNYELIRQHPAPQVGTRLRNTHLCVHVAPIHVCIYEHVMFWGTDVPNCWQRCNRFSLILIICVCRQPLAGICAGAAPSNPPSPCPPPLQRLTISRIVRKTGKIHSYVSGYHNTIKIPRNIDFLAMGGFQKKVFAELKFSKLFRKL